jgi:hypothetical protein
VSQVGATIGGGCVCGCVRYEVMLPFRRASVCHCSRCQKHSGSIGLVQGRVAREQFRLLQGEESIGIWAPDDGGAMKAFCTVCGSSLFGNRWPEGDEISIRLGTLDQDPGIRPAFHSFTDDVPPWDELPDDDLPRFPGAHPL